MLNFFGGKAEMTYLPMCEQPGRILTDSVLSFEADLGRGDCLNKEAIASTKAASCFEVRTAKLTISRRIKHHQGTKQALP